MKTPEKTNLRNYIDTSIDKIAASRIERTNRLSTDMKWIRDNISKLTGGDVFPLGEPIDFSSIIQWSSPSNPVLLFLRGDYNAKTTPIQIRSLSPDDTAEHKELLNIIISCPSSSKHTLTVTVDNDVDIIASTEGDLGRTADEGAKQINQANGSGLRNRFHRLYLAEAAVRFAAAALEQEIRAVEDFPAA